MDGVSVCISAYKTKDYIKECLDSVVNQSWFKTHDNWEIIVGIDGCEETLEYMKTIMHFYKNLRVFMMDSNKGTYITSNTIISNATYEHIFRFDSDDIMCSNLIETVMNKKGNCHFLRYYLQNFGKNTETGRAWGTIYITKTLFKKYGGYKPWPCGADSDLYYRLRSIEAIKTIPDILMLRRVHPDSLTQTKETGMKSDLRKKYAVQIRKNITNPEEAKIEMVTNTYTEITSPLEGTVNKDEYIQNINQKSNNTKKIIIPKQQQKPANRLLEARMKAKAKPSTSSNIAKLRKDIETGKLVRVPVVGGFVWKRIKL